MILIARGTSPDVFLSKKTARLVAIFGVVDAIIHLISLIGIMSIKEPNRAGVPSAIVLEVQIAMCLIS